MGESHKPDPRLLNRLAIEILEAASDEADEYPIERTAAHRLALAWLTLNGIAEDWQAQEFWKQIGTRFEGDGPQGHYIRTTYLYSMIGAWRRAAGLPVDMPTEKGERVRRAKARQKVQ
jgi:hypothetical protein